MILNLFHTVWFSTFHGQCSNFSSPSCGQISHFPWISPKDFPKDLMSQLERLEELRPGTAKRLKVRSADYDIIPLRLPGDLDFC